MLTASEYLLPYLSSLEPFVTPMFATANSKDQYFYVDYCRCQPSAIHHFLCVMFCTHTGQAVQL